MRAGRAAGGAAGRAARAAWQRIKAVSRGNAAQLARRAGRWLLVRCWASMVVRPKQWTGWMAVLGLFGAARVGAWWPMFVAAVPSFLILLKLILSFDSRLNFDILSSVSSRVNTLRLMRRLEAGWIPEMKRLGLAQQRSEDKTITPKLERVRLGEFGVTGQVDLHPLGMIVDDLARHRKRLESVFLARCSITQRGYATAVVEFRHTDPLTRPVLPESVPAPRRRLHVVTRIAENGEPVEQDVILPRLVIGGQGAGKSMELRAFLWALQQAEIPIRLRVFDPKGGMELGDLRDAAYSYESRPDGWAAFISQALGALELRQRSLADRGWNKLTRFTDAEPLDMLVVDELLTVVAQQSQTIKSGPHKDMKAGDLWDQYLSQARAAGYTAFALSQLSQKAVLGHARGLFPHITVLRVPATEREMVDRLLGSAELYPAHEIPPGDRHAGIGFTRTPEGQVVRSRGLYLDEERWRQVVARIAEDKQRRAAAKKSRRQEKAEAVA